MESIMSSIKNIANRDVGPQVFDRKNKKIARERVPLLIELTNHIMFSKPIDYIDRTAFMRKIFKSESIHDGHKYNKEKSAKEIPGFIDFFEIDMSQFIKEKPEEYKTFNDFFTREVKPEARPVAEPDDDSVIVSAADCRLTVFESLEECTDLWIKGEQFSYEELLNNDKELVECFKGGMVANFRLAPQDYHRFHTPVAGRVLKKVELGGETFSVKPKAVESDIDVLGRNERDIVVIQTEKYGKICQVPIGAKAVGRVTVFVEEGQQLKKGEEIGYFSFGGSDIVILFEHPIDWEEDIREHSKKPLETLVQCNEKIGKFRKADKS